MLEFLCGAAASLVYSTTKSPNEAAFQIFLDRWPRLDKLEFKVLKAKSRKEKTECENVIGFCQAALVNDAYRKDYHEILGLILVFLIWMPLHVETISYYVVTVVISVLIDL